MTEIGEPNTAQIKPEKSQEKNIDWGMYINGKPDENSPSPDLVKQTIWELIEKFGPPYNDLLARIIVHEGNLADVDPDWVGYFIQRERMMQRRLALTEPVGNAALNLMKRQGTSDQLSNRESARVRLRRHGERAQPAKDKPPVRSLQAKKVPRAERELPDRSEEPDELDISVHKPHAARTTTTTRKGSTEPMQAGIRVAINADKAERRSRPGVVRMARTTNDILNLHNNRVLASVLVERLAMVSASERAAREYLEEACRAGELIYDGRHYCSAR